MKSNEPSMPTVVREIAKQTLGIEAFENCGSARGDLPLAQIKAALEAAYQAGWERGLPRAAKKRMIRKEIEAYCQDLPWRDREALVQAWAGFPLTTLRESLEAGFYFPDDNNPNVNPDALQDAAGAGEIE